jgi:hypothetical protein
VESIPQVSRERLVGSGAYPHGRWAGRFDASPEAALGGVPFVWGSPAPPTSGRERQSFSRTTTAVAGPR